MRVPHSSKPRVLSGIQPTNVLHIGNYLGAIKQWVDMQKEYECFFCIVDLHAITVQQKSKSLHENIRRLAAFYIACGIDPAVSTIFVQSRVSGHAELAWILNTLVKVSELERMTQYKDKSNQHRTNINAGLLDYPVLMAADILLYDTDVVPVGEDQSQHVELTCTLARRLNTQFGNVLKVAKLKLCVETARIAALDDPMKKMSKSASSAMNYIALDDASKTIQQKFQKAVTDSGRTIVFDPKRPGLYNLLTIYKAFTDESEQAIEEHFRGNGYAALKQEVARVVIQALEPIQDRYHALLDRRSELEQILDAGTKHAHAIARVTLERVFRALGLG